jgi:hypothetical protein
MQICMYVAAAILEAPSPAAAAAAYVSFPLPWNRYVVGYVVLDVIHTSISMAGNLGI